MIKVSFSSSFNGGCSQFRKKFIQVYAQLRAAFVEHRAQFRSAYLFSDYLDCLLQGIVATAYSQSVKIFMIDFYGSSQQNRVIRIHADPLIQIAQESNPITVQAEPRLYEVI